ncbi:MAG: endonuclease [Bacilli bacterium]|nr:endonuclease [Bacilli bacterium]
MKKLNRFLALVLLIPFLVSCGNSSSNPPHEHKPGDLVIENKVDATCVKDGSYDSVVYCVDCHEQLSKEHKTIPALNHDLVHHDGKAPTCTEKGYEPYDTCSRCDYTTYQEIPATGHIHTATKEENRVEADCTNDGHYDLVTYCLDDNVELNREQKTISHLGHDMKTEDHTSEGYILHYCSRCDYSYNEPVGQTIDDIPAPVLPKEKVNAERIYVSVSATSVAVDNYYYVNPVVMPNDAFKNAKYIIEDETILETEGKFFKGKAIGSTLLKIYNDNNENNLYDSDEPLTVMAFSVVDNEDKSISLTQNIELTVGETLNLSPSASGMILVPQALGYYSTDDSVADYANGKLVANKSGECDIYSTSKEFCAKSHVTVVDKKDSSNHILASDVNAKYKTMRLVKGTKKDIEYTLYPSNASEDTPVYLSSSNSSIIDIEEGKVVGKELGTALINISLKDGGYPVETIKVDVVKGEEYDGSYYNNYYGDLTWENGEDLKAKLHAIISKDKKSLNYASPVNWETNSDADHDLYDFSMMASVYGRNIAKSNTNTGWQREHAFCASLMTNTTTGNAVKTLGRATDFHNLYAAYSSGNGSRGNKCLGNANPNAPDYTNKDSYEYTRKWFSPVDDVDKGKLARAIFYMGVMYNDVEHSSFTESSKSIDVDMPALNIIKDNIGYNRLSQAKLINPDSNEYVTLANYYRSLALIENSSYSEDEVKERGYELYLQNALPYCIGGLDDLLDWNTNEVTLEEMHHNESVYSYNSTAGKGCQNNRNPFVDYPELVDYVYGDLRFTAGSLKDLRPTCVALEMNKNETHHFALGDNTKTEYKVGDTISVQSLDLKKVGYDLSISSASDSDLLSNITFAAEDKGSKEITIETTKNTIKLSVTVSDDSGDDPGEGDYTKATAFDASETYYLSPDGSLFAKANIASSVLQFSSAKDDYAAVTFVLAENKTDEYIITITNGATSINLGYSGSSTGLANSATNWKVESYSGGLVLKEAVTNSRYLGMMNATDTRAKAYTSFSSSNIPVYLFISK